LELVLNLSLFYYDIIKDKKKAIEFAQDGLIAAEGKLNDLNKDDKADVLKIINLIQKNL
jgi:hypothetical protein